MDYDIPLTLRVDKQTSEFLIALRDNEQVNISAWVRDAIRAKAGLRDVLACAPATDKGDGQ